MNRFTFLETDIEGLYIIEPKIFGDDRGYFMESYNLREFENANLGINLNFVQDNESMSRKGVLRGIHFQTKYPQDKLVRVIHGTIYDVAVDLRKNSKTYLKCMGILLSDKNKKQFYIPKGFGHGFLVLSDYAIFSYKCTDYYHPEYEDGIIYNDPTINIDWPLDNIEELILSEKDKNWNRIK